MSTDLHTPLYTAGSAAYQELKAAILQGEVPIGVRLREGRIADRLEVSRTPVREALLRLYAERFLERHSEGGFRVAAPRVETLRQLYDVRRALELFALRQATSPAMGRERAAGARLEDLRREWADIAAEAPRPDPEFVLLDEEFHYRLAAAAGNDELCFELGRIAERIRPVRSHDVLTAERVAATAEQHLRILDTVLAGRRELAEELLDRHICESQAVVEVAVVRALERMLAVGGEDSGW